MNRRLKELLALVDRSEERPLTAGEATQLRTSLAAYDQARRQLGAILAKPRDRKGKAA